MEAIPASFLPESSPLQSLPCAIDRRVAQYARDYCNGFSIYALRAERRDLGWTENVETDRRRESPFPQDIQQRRRDWDISDARLRLRLADHSNIVCGLPDLNDEAFKIDVFPSDPPKFFPSNPPEYCRLD